MKRLSPRETINFKELVIASILSLSLSLTGYIIYFQPSFLARREIAFAILLWLLLTPLVYLVLTRFIEPRLGEYTPRARRNWILISVGVGILFALVTRPPEVILLLPKHDLQITVPAGNAERTITLEYAKTALRDIGFGEFEQQGEWQRTEGGLTHTGAEPALLTWSGRTGEEATLVFSNGPGMEGVQMGWDGETGLVVMGEGNTSAVVFGQRFSMGVTGMIFSRALIGFVAGFIFLVIGLYLAEVQIKPAGEVERKRGAWLLYALPMIAVWGLFLLVFYPGLLTQDTTVQWEQVVTGQYSDAHPVFFALLIGGLSRIYNSPAVVVWAQILMLSLSLGWSLEALERLGTPRRVLWVLIVLFAALPINILGAIVLRKDVPFSVGILVLSLIFLKIVLSRGDWLKEKWHWLGLGLTLGAITLSRINGLTISVGSLLVILFFYHPAWKRIISAAGVFALMLVLMYGPVYRVLKVKHVSEFGPVLFLHHIAAHLEAGTPLEGEQADYLASLAPLDGWNYDCCTSNSTVEAIFPGALDQNFDQPILKEDPGRPSRTALQLFLKDPAVDLRHRFCAGQIVWSLKSSCPDRIVVRMDPLELFEDPEDSFKILPNLMGFTADSRLPALIPFANPYLQVYSQGFFHWLNFTPAIFLYLSMIFTGLLAYRRKEWKVILYLVPALLQSITLFLVTISQAYRYQYGVVLVGLISIGFLFVPKIEGVSQVLPGEKEARE